MTGFAELEEAVEAINRGQIFRYIFKPWRVEELVEILGSASRTFILERSHEQLLLQLQQLNAELEERVTQRTKELAEANRQLERKQRELQETNHELEQKNKMLEKLALTDPLTGLPNRRAMDRLAERELRRRERYPHCLTVALIDVDHFKEINARYLLPGGDAVLIELGKVLTGCVRAVDFVGRIGGEEFLVIAPETNMEGAKGLGERIRTNVAEHPFSYNNEAIPVRVSIGLAVVEGEVNADYEHMKHAAAAALSEAKMTGRNRCVFYSMKPSPFEQAG
jgi:diguanylate cyclase (GGDEF)-like protein